LCRIAKGKNIIKYGNPIGRALKAIEPGEHVHIHNLTSKGIEEYNPKRVLALHALFRKNGLSWAIDGPRGKGEFETSRRTYPPSGAQPGLPSE
jgi:hypothetical protein